MHLTSMFRLRRPSADELARIASEQAREELTYPERGATASADLPAGYAHTGLSTVLGHDDRTFAAGVEALRRWAPQRGSGLSVAATGPIIEGTVVALAAPLGPAYALAACRVVYVEDETDRFAFGYGTLPLHAVQGEERFAVARSDDRVEFQVVAFSRPNHPLVRLAGPFSRQMQLRAVRGYLQAMRRATAPAESA